MDQVIDTSLSLDEIGVQYGTDKSSKGHDYLRHYDRAFTALRSTELTIFEIGGLNGTSLRMWQDYFVNGKIVCFDINPNVSQYASERISVEIGDASDRGVLTAALQKHGRPTIVLDDGSHRWDHQRLTFEVLFPALLPGGLYVVEDLHTSYEGGYAGRDNQPFIQYLRQRLDYLNLRRQLRADYIALYPKHTVSISRMIDTATFVSRSCIIQKKANAG